MDLGRAFTYIFDDENWLEKVVMLVVLTFAAILAMPLLFAGLVPLAMLMGYMAQIANNVRDDKPIILPQWADYGDLLNKGIPILTAVIVYNLPVILLALCFWLVPGLFPGDLTAGAVSLVMVCCVLPMLLGYTALAWLMLGVGFTNYMLTGRGQAFFRFGVIFDGVQEIGTVGLQWLLANIAVNIVLGLVFAVPCLGWIAGSALAIPVYGHLLGQLARAIDRRRRKKAGR